MRVLLCRLFVWPKQIKKCAQENGAIFDISLKKGSFISFVLCYLHVEPFILFPVLRGEGIGSNRLRTAICQVQAFGVKIIK